MRRPGFVVIRETYGICSQVCLRASRKSQTRACHFLPTPLMLEFKIFCFIASTFLFSSSSPQPFMSCSCTDFLRLLFLRSICSTIPSTTFVLSEDFFALFECFEASALDFLDLVVFKMEISILMVVSNPQLDFPLGKFVGDVDALQEIKRGGAAVSMQVGILETIFVPLGVKQLTVLDTKGFKQRVHRSFLSIRCIPIPDR